jgi:prophage maintenance system killer protein
VRAWLGTIRFRTERKRVAYLALLEFLARNHIDWSPPSVEETVATIEGVASGRISERDLGDWLRRTRS